MLKAIHESDTFFIFWKINLLENKFINEEVNRYDKLKEKIRDKTESRLTDFGKKISEYCWKMCW